MGLDLVELVLRTEETFAIDIPNEQAATIEIVGDLYRTTLTHLDLPYLPLAEAELTGRDRSRIRHARQLTPDRTWTTPDVARTLRALIIDQLQVDPDEVRESAHFQRDLGSD